MSNAKDITNYRKRRKNNLIQVCGGKCCICGYNKTNSALEFHHIDPSKKDYGIAQGTCHDLEKDLQEVQKCILVCANCHREIHDGLYNEEQLKQLQIFDEEVANQLRQDKIKLQTKNVYICLSCGKEITRYSKSGLCKECAKKESRVIQRPSREELKILIRKKSFTEIARIYEVSDNAIRKWCKAENLPSRKKDINNINDAQWELI